MTIEEALQSGAAALPTREGIPDPRREASWLLAAAWGVDEITRFRLCKALIAEVEGCTPPDFEFGSMFCLK